MKLSIIIPVYNVEKYIERCLLSCMKQDISHSEYEIIVVNDGSSDRSLNIARNIKKKATNIHIISQINAGLSEARNTGLRHAKGEYIWFVDSDDCVKEYSVGKLIKRCEQDNLDMLAVCAADIIHGKEIRRFSYSCKDVVSGKTVLNGGYIQHCVPFTIYRHEFLWQFNLQFYPGIFHEDSEFSPRAYFYAKRVGFTNEIIYLVTINPNSITRTINYKKSFDCLKVAESIHQFQTKISKEENAFFFNNHISLVINNAIANLVRPAEDKLKKKEAISFFVKELHQKQHLFVHLRKSSILKYQIEGCLFSILPCYTIKIYRMLQMFNTQK